LVRYRMHVLARSMGEGGTKDKYMSDRQTVDEWLELLTRMRTAALLLFQIPPEEGLVIKNKDMGEFVGCNR
jgi:hypothetical protein